LQFRRILLAVLPLALLATGLSTPYASASAVLDVTMTIDAGPHIPKAPIKLTTEFDQKLAGTAELIIDNTVVAERQFDYQSTGFSWAPPSAGRYEASIRVSATPSGGVLVQGESAKQTIDVAKSRSAPLVQVEKVYLPSHPVRFGIGVPSDSDRTATERTLLVHLNGRLHSTEVFTGTNPSRNIQIDDLPFGEHVVTVSYTGDEVNEATSTTATISRRKYPPLLITPMCRSSEGQVCGGIQGMSEPVMVGVNLDTTYDHYLLGWQAPKAAGTVLFFNNDKLFASVAADGDRTLKVDITSLGLGTHCFTVTYSGDDNYEPSIPATQCMRVVPKYVPAAPTSTPPPPAVDYRLVRYDGAVIDSSRTRGGSVDMGARPNLSGPAIGAAAVPNGTGLWEVTGDGGVFGVTGAPFFGSMGGQPLNMPIMGMLTTPSGNGYWLAASDSGLFTFGDAPFKGNMTPPASHANTGGWVAITS
jgi:hypothetical protein